jgi:hypothetical protein
VTTTFNAPTAYVDIRALEYGGLDPVDPFDVGASAAGTGTAANSGKVNTTAPGLVFGAGTTGGYFSNAGANFTTRIITDDADIASDQFVTAPGAYSATAPLTGSARWVMQVATFRAASKTTSTPPITTPAPPITTNGDTKSPTVAITAPTGSVPGTVTIRATATDNVGVASVQFLVDNNPLGAAHTTSPYSVTWNTATAANGTHTLTALARDTSGNTAVSAPVTVTVANAAAAPAAALNQPANPGLLMYANGAPPASVVANWSRPGALVVVGRSNYNQPWVHTMADGGATVLIYLDPMINNDTGRYHDKLINASEFGPAVPKWPGKPAANEYGSLNDFRVGSVLQDKLPGVIDLMISENPQISGIFLDDVGSRPWYPGINWDSWSNADKEAYRNGAIAITKTARAAADKHDLFLMVNGTWGATGVAGQGSGGYPNRALPGNSLVDGGFVENHDPDTQFAYWAAYSDPHTSQWGADTPRGLPYMWFSNVGSSADRDKWIASGLAAFASSGAYDGTALPFGTFTDFHLPNRATTQL